MKSKQPSKSADDFRYEPEDLEPRDTAADKATVNAYIERNKDALNASIDKAHAEFERGAYLTQDQVKANIDARRAAAGLIEASRGVTLGSLKIKDLVNEGRP